MNDKYESFGVLKRSDSTTVKNKTGPQYGTVRAYLRQECHNSKFGIFELLVWKETFADALLTSIVS